MPQTAQATIDSTNQLLLTIKDVGVAVVIAIILGLAIIALILLVRSRSKSDADTSKQTERLLEMFGKALNNQDSETAKAIRQQTEVITLNRISLDQNTLAFQENRQYREDTLATTKELTGLQSINNDLVAALRIDVSAWPKEVMSSMGTLEKNLTTGIDRIDVNVLRVVNGFGSLDETVRDIAKLVQNNPNDHQQVLEALQHIAAAQQQIFTLIDSRLPASAKTDTPAPLRHAPALPPAPSNEALNLKRTTDVFTSVKPEDATPGDKAS